MQPDLTQPDGPPLEAVILDLDGVVTRTARVLARAWREMFDEFLAERAASGDGPAEPFDPDEDYRRRSRGARRSRPVSNGRRRPPSWTTTGR